MRAHASAASGQGEEKRKGTAVANAQALQFESTLWKVERSALRFLWNRGVVSRCSLLENAAGAYAVSPLVIERVNSQKKVPCCRLVRCASKRNVGSVWEHPYVVGL